MEGGGSPFQRNFTSFLQQALVRFVAANNDVGGGHSEAGFPIEQMAERTSMLLAPSGRASTLSRGNVPASAAAAASPPGGVPRAPPTAGAPYVTDGASEALDLRSLALGTWALSNAEYHYRRAKETVANAAAGGSGTTRATQEPFDPYAVLSLFSCVAAHARFARQLRVQHGARGVEPHGAAHAL